MRNSATDWLYLKEVTSKSFLPAWKSCYLTPWFRLSLMNKNKTKLTNIFPLVT